MEFKTFIGPAYSGRAKIVSAEKCINLYPEKTETPGGKSAMSLIGTPGKALFCTLAAGVPTVRGLWLEPPSGRVFAAASNVFYEIFANGVVTARGTFAEPANLTGPVTMRSNGTQMVISSNGAGYVFTLATNILLQLNAANFPFVSQNQPGAAGFPGSSQFDFLDTFFVTISPGTNRFYVSLASDATDWGALNFASKSSWPDNLTAMVMNRRDLWLLGSQRGEVWWDAGNPGGVPFERLQGASIEVGIEAQMTLQRADTGVTWLGASEFGGGIAYRNDGYEPKRISTHGVEYEWQKITRSDCEAYSYQEGGHTFWSLWFPSADQTWVYDYASGLWHQRDSLDPNTGLHHADLARNHTFAFGKHLVGDRSSGNIYNQSLDIFTENGNAIRRLRSSSVFQERRWVYYKYLDIYGLSGQADGVQGPGTEPIGSLRISDDGGFTWGNFIDVPLGFTSQYGYRWQWRNLGRSRDRVFEFTTSEPIQIALVDAYLEALQGQA